MAALLGGSLTIRTSISADIFNANINMSHHHKKASDNNSKNDGSSAVKPTPPCAVKSKVATTTPKMSIFFNQSGDIKIGYFGIFKFVDSQMDHHETFGEDPMIFPANPTKQNKTTSEKELYALSEI